MLIFDVFFRRTAALEALMLIAKVEHSASIVATLKKG